MCFGLVWFVERRPFYNSPQSAMTTGSAGLSMAAVLEFSMVCTTSKPSTTCPKTVCLPSSQGVGTAKRGAVSSDSGSSSAKRRFIVGWIPERVDILRNEVAKERCKSWGESGGLTCADEELGTVGVWPRVGHAQHARSSVLKVEVLVGEGSAVDALAPRSVSCGEVSSLDHEVLDDSVELAALVSEAGLAGAELAEVLGGLGDVVAEEPHHHAPGGHAADFNVEVHLGGDVRDRALVRGGGGGPEARGRGSGRHHVGRLPRGPRPRGRSEAALWLRAWPAGARSQAAVGSELPRRPHHTLHRRRHVVLPFSLAELISTPVPSSVVVVRRLSSTRHSLTHSLTRVVVALSLSLTASLRLCCACLQKRG
mmetsp:Transcript_10871/g.22629  ORF Transcript_10871/g.22629 Transcript_10871/m.22629 type:complete len:367 (+) Transcript_10871:69-1169(+)